MAKKPTLIPAESWAEVEAHIAKKRTIREAATKVREDEVKARRDRQLAEEHALKLATDEQKRMIKERKKAKGIKPKATPEAMKVEIQARKDRAAWTDDVTQALVELGLAGQVSSEDDSKRRLTAQAKEYARKHGW